MRDHLQGLNVIFEQISHHLDPYCLAGKSLDYYWTIVKLSGGFPASRAIETYQQITIICSQGETYHQEPLRDVLRRAVKDKR